MNTSPIIQFRPKTQQVPEAKRKVEVKTEVKSQPVDNLVMSPKKEQRVFHIDEIAPSALEMGIDAMNLSHPITVPFMVTNKDTPSSTHSFSDAPNTGVESMGDIYQRECENFDNTKELITTSIAENLFRNSSDIKDNNAAKYFGNNELLFFQFPSKLPFLKPDMEVETPQVIRYDNGFKNNLQDIKDGKIGKIYILKSGKVKLVIDDNVFDISQGMPCGFLQELHYMNLKSKEMCHLGDINKRIVVSPDIQDLLKKQT